MEKVYWVYIMASKRNGTLYVGMTGHLARRIWEHQNKINKGFTKKYGVNRLVYAEPPRRTRVCYLSRKMHQTVAAIMENQTD